MQQRLSRTEGWTSTRPRIQDSIPDALTGVLEGARIPIPGFRDLKPLSSREKIIDIVVVSVAGTIYDAPFFFRFARHLGPLLEACSHPELKVLLKDSLRRFIYLPQ